MSTTPAHCAGSPPGTGRFTFQRVNNHGTSPAAVAGATANTAVPMAASLFSRDVSPDAVMLII
jgi:hypothetical protein